MPAFKLILKAELEQFSATLKNHGWNNEPFTIEEEAYDPAKAEVESETGEVIVACTGRTGYASTISAVGPPG